MLFAVLPHFPRQGKLIHETRLTVRQARNSRVSLTFHPAFSSLFRFSLHYVSRHKPDRINSQESPKLTHRSTAADGGCLAPQ